MGMVIERILILALVVFIAMPAYSFPPTEELELKAGEGSKYCLGCHNELGARPKQMQHPVDVDYRSAREKSKGRLKDVSQLDPATKLESGKVVCMTCHDPKSTLPAKLVMNNVESRLCQACHEL